MKIKILLASAFLLRCAGAQDLFIADNAGRIDQIAGGSTNATVFSSGGALNVAQGLAFNDGNLFMASFAGTIDEIAAGSTNSTLFSSGGALVTPSGVAFIDGNLFIADNVGTIDEIADGSTNATIFSSGGALSGPQALATVPEPATYALLGLGALVLACRRRA